MTRTSFLPSSSLASQESHVILALFAILPIVVVFANYEVLGNRVADIDTWFYYGHFTSFGQYRNVDALIGNNYYQTRLPYLIPGFVIFSLFSEAWAKFILAYLSYAATTASFYYLVATNFDRQKAVLVTALFATDVFFVRGYGWNYVDIGVLAYFTMGMAAITWASRGQVGRFAKLGVAGFAFACMLFVHLGSAILAAPALAYVWYVMPEARTRRGMNLVVAGLFVGAVVAQLIFGGLNKAIWGSRFFFLLEQVAVGKIELKTNPSWESPVALLRNGPWVTVHFGIWLGAVAALILSRFRRPRFEHREIIWLLSVVVLYAALFAVDVAGFSNFTMREGLRMTFFLTTSYFCLPFLISARLPRWATVSIVAIAVITLATNLRIHLDEHLVDGRILALVIALALGIGFHLQRAVITTVALVLVIAARFFVAWPFAQNETIYQAHALIKSLAGDDLPRFITSDKDPLYGSLLACVISTFTERAWWMHGMNFPDLPPLAMWHKTKVFLLSSTIKDPGEAERLLGPKVDKIEAIGSFRLGTSSNTFYVSQFEVTNRTGFPSVFAKFQQQRTAIPASALPSTLGVDSIVGDDRIADSKSKAGYLTFGPYVSLAQGKYRFAFKYGPSSGQQEWDIVVPDPVKGSRTLAKGTFAETDKSGQEMTVDIDIPRDIINLEARTHFSGSGTLGVSAIGIIPLD